MPCSASMMEAPLFFEPTPSPKVGLQRSSVLLELTRITLARNLGILTCNAEVVVEYGLFVKTAVGRGHSAGRLQQRDDRLRDYKAATGRGRVLNRAKLSGTLRCPARSLRPRKGGFSKRLMRWCDEFSSR